MSSAPPQKGLFPEPLVVQDANGARNWVLVEPFSYQTSRRQVICVPRGTVWNGASIPRFFWRVIGSPFCGRHRRPSVIHDCLWERARRGACTFSEANWAFWDGLRSEGVGPVKAWLMWAAVASADGLGCRRCNRTERPSLTTAQSCLRSFNC